MSLVDAAGGPGQERRLFALESVLGEDRLWLDEFHGMETVSEPFRFSLGLLSESADLTLGEVLGTLMTVRLGTGQPGDRLFHGYVTAFRRTGPKGGFWSYQAILRPFTAFLACRKRCRVHPQATRSQIIQRACDEYGTVAHVEFRLQAQEAPLGPRVQYEESDLDFILRLAEEAGWVFHFRHGTDRHTLVFQEDGRRAEAMPTSRVLAMAGSPATDALWGWEEGRFPTLGTLESGQPDFQDPGVRLSRDETAELASLLREDWNDTPRWFRGEGSLRHLVPGHWFELGGKEGRRFLLWSLEHEGRNHPGGGGDYRNRFESTGLDLGSRPERRLAKPILRGPLTATVVDPAGHGSPEASGRILVRFPWGDPDGQSLCWVPVATRGDEPLPALHEEVVVDFLDGDPDRPLITGVVRTSGRPEAGTTECAAVAPVVVAPETPAPTVDIAVRDEDRTEALLIRALTVNETPEPLAQDAALPPRPLVEPVPIREEVRLPSACGKVMQAMDEAAFLYSQAKCVIVSEIFPWTVAEDFEVQMEANLDLLDDPATFPPLHAIPHLEEPGRQYTLIRALCYQGRLDELLERLTTVELAQSAQFQAVLDALRDGLPVDWLEPALEVLWPKNPALACRLMGIRWYYPGGERLLTCAETFPAWAWALGRLQLPGTQEMLKMTLLHEDDEVVWQAALALLRMGEGDFFKKQPVTNPGWFALTQALLHRTPPPGPTPDHALALGILGDPVAVPFLMTALSEPKLAAAAARGLFAMTGAPLRETILVTKAVPPCQAKVAGHGAADDVLLDALMGVLDEAPAAVQEPEEEEQEPAKQERISQDPVQWREWWETHRTSYASGTHYRLGRPSNPLWLLETMADPDTPQWLRALTLEELQISHGIDLPFDLDCQVRTQREAIQKNEGHPVSPLARRLMLEESWKTALIRRAPSERVAAEPKTPAPAPAGDLREPALARREDPWLQKQEDPREPARLEGISARKGWQEDEAGQVPRPAAAQSGEDRRGTREGWKTAMVRGMRSQLPSSERRGSQPEPVGSGPTGAKEGWKDVTPREAPQPLEIGRGQGRGSAKEGWKTAMIRGAKGHQPAGARPVPAPAAPVGAQEGWKVAAPLEAPQPLEIGRGQVRSSAKEGWKTAMIRGAQGPKDPAAKRENPAGSATAGRSQTKEGWKTAVIRIVRGGPKKT